MTGATSESGYLPAEWGAAAQASGGRRRAAPAREPVDPAAREHDRAAALIERAKQVLRDQFDALRNGGTIDFGAIRRTTRDVTRSITRNRYAVIGLTRLRSSHEYTYIHSIAVSALMIGLARELGLPPAEVEAVGLAGMLHDIGKSRVPIEVLDKPGPLSAAEWATIRTHPGRGHAILSRFDGVDPIVLDVTLHHHERIDGTGYPHGLAGDRISVHARIGAVCDVYDALTSRRAYKEAKPAAAVLELMGRNGGQFDPQMLRALRTLIGAFPAGTLVRLQRGQLAIVLNEVPADPLSPRVELVYCADTRRPLAPAVQDTRDNPIVAVERPEAWPALALGDA